MPGVTWPTVGGASIRLYASGMSDLFVASIMFTEIDDGPRSRCDLVVGRAERDIDGEGNVNLYGPHDDAGSWIVGPHKVWGSIGPDDGTDNVEFVATGMLTALGWRRVSDDWTRQQYEWAEDSGGFLRVEVEKVPI